MSIKKSMSIFLLILVLAISLSACGEDTPEAPETIYYTVNFDYNNGEGISTTKVANGSPLTEPRTPERDGYIFDGWKNGAYNWDFSMNLVNKDLTLVATWIDASAIFDYSPNDDGTITVTGYSGTLSALRIPSYISGKKVSGVADRLFESLMIDTLDEIVLPDTVRSIGNESFANCSGTPITIGGRITLLGERAFENCDGIKKITLGDGLESIPFSAFASCTSLSTITIPESVRVVEENAFYKCSSITTIVIRSKDLTVENSAFSGCDSIKSVFFMGNEDEWQAVIDKVDNGGRENSSLLDADIYFYSPNEPEEDGNYWYFNDSGDPRCW